MHEFLPMLAGSSIGCHKAQKRITKRAKPERLSQYSQYQMKDACAEEGGAGKGEHPGEHDAARRSPADGGKAAGGADAGGGAGDGGGGAAKSWSRRNRRSTLGGR